MTDKKSWDAQATSSLLQQNTENQKCLMNILLTNTSTKIPEPETSIPKIVINEISIDNYSITQLYLTLLCVVKVL